MNAYVYILIFFLGSAIGSFLNVVADRYHSGMSFTFGKSICFVCGKKIKLSDLIPVISYIKLLGKCRYCGQKIPSVLFLSELIMGVLTLFAFVKADLLSFVYIGDFTYVIWAGFLLHVLISGLVLLIALYDLKHFIIPDNFLILLAIASIFFNLIQGFSVTYIIAAVVLSLPFLALFLLSKGTWLGLGDVKYIFVIGLLLGLSNGLTAVIFAFWIGAAYSLIAMFLERVLPHVGLLKNSKGLTMKTEIPFGPFLSLGVVVALYFRIELFNLNLIALF